MEKIKKNIFKGIDKVAALRDDAVAALKNKKGEGYIDTAVKIIISVVLGALLLGGLYTLFNTVVMPTLTTKVTNLFNYVP